MVNRDYKAIVHKVNCLASELDGLYHKAARKLGLADSVLLVIYIIYEKGEGCLLYDVCNESGVSKQTINSAIRKLEKDNIIYLKQDKGKTKRIFLTDKGKEFAKITAVPLLEAECNAFKDWDDEEFELYLKLMEKYNNAFKLEIDKMKGRNL